MQLEPELQLVFYKYTYPPFRSQAVEMQVSVCLDGRRPRGGEEMGTLLATASGHLRPKCFRVGIKRRDALCLWGWQWGEVGQSSVRLERLRGPGKKLQLLVPRQEGGK